MIDIKNISDLSLSQNEYCYTANTWQYYGNSSFKMTIPKMMTNVPSGEKIESFNRNILLNANECKPSVNNKINTQDYVTITRSNQCYLLHKSANINLEIPPNTRFICLCMNNNYKDLVIIDA